MNSIGSSASKKYDRPMRNGAHGQQFATDNQQQIDAIAVKQ